MLGLILINRKIRMIQRIIQELREQEDQVCLKYNSFFVNVKLYLKRLAGLLTNCPTQDSLIF